MRLCVTRKLIESHRLEGRTIPGEEIALRVDQTLTQDATGTLVMLELEAMEIDQVRTEISVQYVDHNLVQEDHKNADDHLFLRSACQRFGVWYSKPGNGVSHPVHMQRFGKPGKTLLGSDSHTCAAGALGMLGIGTGGLEVALAMVGEPFFVRMPKVMGVRLTGQLPNWVSAKDIILEMLRRHGVDGGINHVIEYYGPGLDGLSAMDRHVIANMGAELGATTSVFPSDQVTRRFLQSERRGDDWIEIVADRGAEYDAHDEINLSKLEPLIALPSSPGNVVLVREVEGREIYQAYVGSSANPGFRDLAVPALMMKGRQAHHAVSFDINPASRGTLEDLVKTGMIAHLLHAGARLHQAGCNGCIGMGQAPASGKNSLRTVPRNFPGRSGTKEDSVYLCSPETATASALTGVITDPRGLGIPWVEAPALDEPTVNMAMFLRPLSAEDARKVGLVKGPNIQSIPKMESLPDRFELPVVLKVGDNVSTDEILPAGSRVLPFRSNIAAIAEFAFNPIDATYPARARAAQEDGGHIVIGGRNYGQGSSREHAALAPRYLGLRVVIAKGFARIHWENLVNFGILPITFADPADAEFVARGDVLILENLHRSLPKSREVRVHRQSGGQFTCLHALSSRQVDVLLPGGLLNWMRERAGERRH